ncbi:hypothetical protein AKJ16_DCAP10613 [Drosera capensis]
MSRCFAYPPPGYAGKCVSNETSLFMSSTEDLLFSGYHNEEGITGIESSRNSESKQAREDTNDGFVCKLQRENETAKTDEKLLRIKEKKEKKEKRKERKYKKEKKEKKAKEKSCEEQIPKLTAGSEITVVQGKSDKDAPGFLRKSNLVVSNLELLDKSNLTEEHGRPCNSSESTESSAKRKRDSEPAGSAQNHGKSFRIKLSSGKREDLTSTAKSVGPCSPLSFGEGTVTQQECKSVLNLPHNPPNPPSKAALTMAPHAQNLGKSVNAHARIADQQLSKSAKALPPFPERIEVSTSSRPPISCFCVTKILKMEVKHIDDAPSPLLERIEVSSSIHAASMSDGKGLLKVEPNNKDPLQSHNTFPPLPERTDGAGPSNASSSSRSHDKKMDKAAAKYRDLLEMLPLSLGAELTDSDDQGWLFPRRRREGNDYPSKRLKVEENILPSCGSYTLQPQAVYLADAGIYGLPYTVPF